MKIKNDFITNSSSTSFVLQYNCHLKEKIVKKEIDCQKSLESVFEIYCNNPHSHIDHYSSAQSASLLGAYLINEDDENDTHGTLEIELINSETYMTKSDKISKTVLLNLAANSLVENSNSGEVYTNTLMNILDEALKDVEGNLEVLFHQFPSEVLGDGWDTGDPMGQYTTKYELFKKETKLGRMTRKRGVWNLELKK